MNRDTSEDRSKELHNSHSDSHSNHNRNNSMDHKGMSMDTEMNEIDMNVEPRPWNLILFIIILIPRCFYLMWLTKKGDNRTLLQNFSDANYSRACFGI